MIYFLEKERKKEKYNGVVYNLHVAIINCVQSIELAGQRGATIKQDKCVCLAHESYFIHRIFVYSDPRVELGNNRWESTRR